MVQSNTGVGVAMNGKVVMISKKIIAVIGTFSICVPFSIRAGSDNGDPYPGCVKIFDGKSFDGWVADPSTWSIVDGAMRGVGGTSRLAFTTKDYGSFRLIFTARMNPVIN